MLPRDRQNERLQFTQKTVFRPKVGKPPCARLCKESCFAGTGQTLEAATPHRAAQLNMPQTGTVIVVVRKACGKADSDDEPDTVTQRRAGSALSLAVKRFEEQEQGARRRAMATMHMYHTDSQAELWQLPALAIAGTLAIAAGPSDNRENL